MEVMSFMKESPIITIVEEYGTMMAAMVAVVAAAVVAAVAAVLVLVLVVAVETDI
jgi:hypothetical protein